MRHHKVKGVPLPEIFDGSEINRYFPELLTNGKSLTLSQSQLIIAREYGFGFMGQMIAAVQAIHAGQWKGLTEADEDALQAFMAALIAAHWDRAESILSQHPEILRTPFEWQRFSPLFHMID